MAAAGGAGPALPARILRRPAFHLALVALVGVAAYANSLGVPFAFDDWGAILDNPALRDLAAFFPPWRFPGGVNRYVALLTFALEYRIHGLSPAGFHAVNLSIHVAAASVLYALARLTMRVARPPGPQPAADALGALLAALVFVAHPVETQAVTYVVQRMASLATLLYLASLLCYAAARLRPPGARSGFLYVGSLAAALLAMGTKEIAFTLPIAIVVYDLAFLGGPPRRRVAWLLPLAATLAVIPLEKLAQSPGADLATAFDRATRVMASVPRLHYLLTQATVVVRYLALLVVPVGQRVEYDLPLRTSLLDPAVAASVLFLALLLASGFSLLFRRRATRDPLARVAGFGIVLFFLGLSVESTLVPIVDLAFEHRVYLPSAGAFLSLGAGFAMLEERAAGRARGAILAALAAAWVIALAGATRVRNEVWKNPIALWSEAVARSPGSARAHYAYGIALWESYDFQRAASEWKVALELNPGNPMVLTNLGAYHELAGEAPRAIECYRRALAVAPGMAVTHYRLAALLEGSGDRDEALAHYRQFVRLAPLSLAPQVAALRARLGRAVDP